MISKYRKKPVVIEAIQWTGVNSDEIQNFCREADYNRHEKTFLIHTLEGALKAMSGDYIIKGIKSEFYPCRADIFEETYELILEGNTNTDS